MRLDELTDIISAAGGGENALAYAESLLDKINRIEPEKQSAALLVQLRAAKEQGDFRGRVFEVNFADCFLRKGIALDYGAKQGMPGDIDFAWNIEGHKIHVELKLLGQDKATRDSINAQLEDKEVSATFLDDDTKDVARLQTDLIQKASTRKFNPQPSADSINLVGVDVTELQLGAVNICDCLLAVGGNSVAVRHCDPACLRDSIVGVFEAIAPEKLSASQRDWISVVQKVLAGAPHPRDYIHGVNGDVKAPDCGG
ncbi:MAG: hypothetical protein HYX63_23175 [Gammaproteobacteria bacterium]|nr:hypothetical protein [Gammaproteobacteria bacterium]